MYRSNQCQDFMDLAKHHSDIKINKNKKSLDPFRAKKIFMRKAGDLSYKNLISGPIRSGKRSQRKYCKLANITRQSGVSKTEISRKITQIL